MLPARGLAGLERADQALAQRVCHLDPDGLRLLGSGVDLGEREGVLPLGLRLLAARAGRRLRQIHGLAPDLRRNNFV